MLSVKHSVLNKNEQNKHQLAGHFAKSLISCILHPFNSDGGLRLIPASNDRKGAITWMRRYLRPPESDKKNTRSLIHFALYASREAIVAFVQMIGKMAATWA